jgi:hypothetical protein
MGNVSERGGIQQRDRAYSVHPRDKKCVQNFVGDLKVREHSGRLRVARKID